MRLEPAATRSRVKHSRSHDKVLVNRFFKVPQERCDKVSWPSRHGQSCWLGDVNSKTNKTQIFLLAQKLLPAQNWLLAQKFLLFIAQKFLLARKFLLAQNLLLAQKLLLAKILLLAQNFCRNKICCRHKCAVTWDYHEITNNVVCATCKGSDQPAHTRRLIRTFACRLIIILVLSYWSNVIRFSKLNRRLHRFVWVNTCQNGTLLEITCHGSNIPDYRAA